MDNDKVGDIKYHIGEMQNIDSSVYRLCFGRLERFLPVPVHRTKRSRYISVGGKSLHGHAPGE